MLNSIWSATILMHNYWKLDIPDNGWSWPQEVQKLKCCTFGWIGTRTPLYQLTQLSSQIYKRHPMVSPSQWKKPENPKALANEAEYVEDL